MLPMKIRGNSNNPIASAQVQELERSEAFLRSRLSIGTIVNKQRLGGRSSKLRDTMPWR